MCIIGLTPMPTLKRASLCCQYAFARVLWGQGPLQVHQDLCQARQGRKTAHSSHSESIELSRPQLPNYKKQVCHAILYRSRRPSSD